MTITALSKTENDRTPRTSKRDNRSRVQEWPQLVGLSELDLKTEQLQPLHWLAHPFPVELKATLETTPPDIATIIRQSLAVDVYKKRAVSSDDGPSDAPQAGDRRSLMSDSQHRVRNSLTSHLSRLSLLNHSDGSRSPSKLSGDTGSIKGHLGWIAGKTSHPTRGLRDRLRERNTFK
ncbi:hypothetical protein ACJ72_01287 [Emergomyces africanus]|uniref:Uncharacterized protein n=1 Tax=Emergomyces africanus TaxID=1955775 RepID=A0A1B7P5N5_9EURO|nr:hypothetical protein ACJ72_01287 [Emergomyces africanus]